MSIQNEPHYEIQARELADWLDRQDEESWWTVDGDPRLMGLVSFPCSAKELASILRRMPNAPLVVLAPPDELSTMGRHITALELDRIAQWDDKDKKNRVFTFSWRDDADENEWVLAEDTYAGRVATVLMRGVGT